MWIKGIIIHPEILLICSEQEKIKFKEFLETSDLQLFGFSTHFNEDLKKEIENLGGEFITKEEVGYNKGSPKWVEYIENNFQIPHNKLVYISFGSKKYDWITAINSSVFYFHYLPEKSLTSEKLPEEIKEYALCFTNLTRILNFINIFLKDPPLFTYKVDLDEKTKYRVLFDAGVKLKDYSGSPFSLQDLFTYSKNYYIGAKKFNVKAVLFLFLVIQLWKEDLARKGVIWCIYPSSKKGKISPNMEPYLRFFRGLTGSYYKPVFIRVEDTLDKSDARRKSEYYKINFTKERDTLQICEKVKGKRIIVVDDFTTTGMSLEIAKLLLLESGASEIILCAIGKYGYDHNLYRLDGEIIESIPLFPNIQHQEKLIELFNSFNQVF